MVLIVITFNMLRKGGWYLTTKFFVITIAIMAKQKRGPGAPTKPPEKAKAAVLQIRLNAAEKQAFERAAELDGKKTSEWMRDRLRRLARQELEEHGQPVPFLPSRES